MTDQAALYARLHPTRWVCLHGDPPCTASTGRCSDGCGPVPTPHPLTMEQNQ